MIGDQIFTDILGANRAGIKSIMVKLYDFRKKNISAKDVILKKLYFFLTGVKNGKNIENSSAK